MNSFDSSHFRFLLKNKYFFWEYKYFFFQTQIERASEVKIVNLKKVLTLKTLENIFQLMKIREIIIEHLILTTSP